MTLMFETAYIFSLLSLAAAAIIAWHMGRYRPGEHWGTRCVWIIFGLISSAGGLLLYFGFFDVIMDFVRREIKEPALQFFREMDSK